MDLEEVYLRQIDQKLKQNNELHEESNKLLREILRELTKSQNVVGREMTNTDIYMIIEASVLLAFVGYMWWRSQPPKKQGKYFGYMFYVRSILFLCMCYNFGKRFRDIYFR